MAAGRRLAAPSSSWPSPNRPRRPRSMGQSLASLPANRMPPTRSACGLILRGMMAGPGSAGRLPWRAETRGLTLEPELPGYQLAPEAERDGRQRSPASDLMVAGGRDHMWRCEPGRRSPGRRGGRLPPEPQSTSRFGYGSPYWWGICSLRSACSCCGPAGHRLGVGLTSDRGCPFLTVRSALRRPRPRYLSLAGVAARVRCRQGRPADG